MSRPIKRGEIYWIDPPKTGGSAQTGHRPGLIIQNDVGNNISPVTIVMVGTTNTSKEYPIDVTVKAHDSGLPSDTRFMGNQIFTVPVSALSGKAGEIPPVIMAQIDQALKTSLSLK